MHAMVACPECGVPGIPVPELCRCVHTAEVLEGEWAVCPNPGCRISCFRSGEKRDLDFFLVPLWFKDRGDGVPVCYCSLLTRGEVRAAVASGCRTAVDVRRMTGKNRTGHCRTDNPLGCCCEELLQFTIRQTLTGLEKNEREPELPFF